MTARILSGGISRLPTENYELKDQLGRGTFAVVHRARHRQTNKEFAIKEVSKKSMEADTLKMLQNEYQSLQQVSRHPGVVTLNEALETDDTLYFVLDLISGGPLLDKIVTRGRFSEEDARRVIRSVLKTLSFMSSLGVVHRDIKPENLLVDNDPSQWPVKLTDFGLSAKVQASERLYDVCGTPYFIAPEVISGKGYGSECDVWSIGVVLYIILCGYPPFFHDDHRKLFSEICTGSYSFPQEEWQHVSDDAKDAIRGMLRVDTNARLSAEDCLSLPWFAGIQSTAQLPNQKLSDFNAKRKMKSVMIAATAGISFMSLVPQTSSGNLSSTLSQLKRGRSSALPTLTTSERQQISGFAKKYQPGASHSPTAYTETASNTRRALKSLLFGESGKARHPGSPLSGPVDRTPLEKLMDEYDPEEFARKVGLLLKTIDSFYSVLDKSGPDGLLWHDASSSQENQGLHGERVLRRLKTARSAAKVIDRAHARDQVDEGGAWGHLKKSFSIVDGGAGPNGLPRMPSNVSSHRPSTRHGMMPRASNRTNDQSISGLSNNARDAEEFGEFGGLDDLLSSTDDLGELPTSPSNKEEGPTNRLSSALGVSSNLQHCVTSEVAHNRTTQVNSALKSNLVRSATTGSSRSACQRSNYDEAVPHGSSQRLRPSLPELDFSGHSSAAGPSLHRSATAVPERQSMKPPKLDKLNLHCLASKGDQGRANLPDSEATEMPTGVAALVPSQISLQGPREDES